MLAIAGLYVIDGGQFLILAGHYTNDKYIRDLNRREQVRVAQAEPLRTALMEGENSGVP